VIALTVILDSEDWWIPKREILAKRKKGANENEMYPDCRGNFYPRENDTGKANMLQTGNLPLSGPDFEPFQPLLDISLEPVTLTIGSGDDMQNRMAMYYWPKKTEIVPVHRAQFFLAFLSTILNIFGPRFS